MAKEHVRHTQDGFTTDRPCPLSPEMRAYAREVRELYRLAGASSQLLTARQPTVTTRDQPVTARDHTRSTLVTTTDQPSTNHRQPVTTHGHDAEEPQKPDSTGVVVSIWSRLPVAKKH